MNKMYSTRRLLLAAILFALPLGCESKSDYEPRVGPTPGLYERSSPFDAPPTQTPPAEAATIDERDFPQLDRGERMADGGPIDPGAPYSPPDQSAQDYYPQSQSYGGGELSVAPAVGYDYYTYGRPLGVSPYDPWYARGAYDHTYRPYDHYYRYDGRYLPDDRWRGRDDVHTPRNRDRPIPPRDREQNRDPREDRSPRTPYQPGEIRREALPAGPPYRDGKAAIEDRRRDEGQRQPREKVEDPGRADDTTHLRDENAQREANKQRDDREARQRENRDKAVQQQREQDVKKDAHAERENARRDQNAQRERDAQRQQEAQRQRDSQRERDAQQARDAQKAAEQQRNQEKVRDAGRQPDPDRRRENNNRRDDSPREPRKR